MKTLIIATVLVLSILLPAAYADEASQKAITEDLLQIISPMVRIICG